MRLIEAFGLMRMDLVYREVIPAKKPVTFYYNPQHAGLMLITKPNGGKADALNVGINVARSLTSARWTRIPSSKEKLY